MNPIIQWKTLLINIGFLSFGYLVNRAANFHLASEMIVLTWEHNCDVLYGVSLGHI